MKIALTITLDANDNLHEHEIRSVLVDALAEFIATRKPGAQTYVDAQYPATENAPRSAHWRKLKIAHVQSRVRTAKMLQNSLGRANIEVTLP
jgi:hypothetical protein